MSSLKSDGSRPEIVDTNEEELATAAAGAVCP